VLLIAACSKQYKNPDSVDPNTNNPFSGPPVTPTAGSQLNKLFKDLRSTPEKQCVTAGVAQQITFAKGTRLTFYPNSFKDKNGNIITEGTVCIEMTEMYKPGDMIANRATTLSDEGILQSGGQVYIYASKDGEEVFANKYGIAYKQPAASTQPMDLYYGNTNNEDSVVTWTKANTTLPGTTANGTWVDSVGSVEYYLFDSCTDFTFVNCDKFSDGLNTGRTEVKVVAPDTSYNTVTTDTYILLRDKNALVHYNFYSNSNHAFQFGHDGFTHQIPIGFDATVVLISNKNGTYYYFEQTAIITDGMIFNATPVAMPLDEIKAKLAAL
jgi:hypothetical protein